MYKIEIIGNNVIITDVTNNNIILEEPYHLVRVKDINNSKAQLNCEYFKDHKQNNFELFLEYNTTQDHTGIIYNSHSDFISFLRANLGNKYGGSASLPTNVQIVDTYIELNDGIELGDIAYKRNSEGSRWRTYLFGGDYYPKGWYIWDGSIWRSDKNDVSNELYNLISATNKLQTFNRIYKNLDSYNETLNYNSKNQITTIIYDLGDSNNITKTFNYLNNNIVSITLSGTLPSNLLHTTKTFTYTNNLITNINYI